MCYVTIRLPHAVPSTEAKYSYSRSVEVFCGVRENVRRVYSLYNDNCFGSSTNAFKEQDRPQYLISLVTSQCSRRRRMSNGNGQNTTLYSYSYLHYLSSLTVAALNVPCSHTFLVSAPNVLTADDVHSCRSFARRKATGESGNKLSALPPKQGFSRWRNTMSRPLPALGKRSII